MIVDYHMHLRGPADGREGPIEHTVGAVERFAEACTTACWRSPRAMSFSDGSSWFWRMRE